MFLHYFTTFQTARTLLDFIFRYYTVFIVCLLNVLYLSLDPDRSLLSVPSDSGAIWLSSSDQGKVKVRLLHIWGEITMLSSALISASSIQQIYRARVSHTACLTTCLTSWTLPWLSLASIPPVYSCCVWLTCVCLKCWVNYWANVAQLLTVNYLTKDFISIVMIYISKYVFY